MQSLVLKKNRVLCNKIPLTNFPKTVHFFSEAKKELAKEVKNETPYTLAHPIWKKEHIDAIEITHKDAKSLSDKWAFFSVWVLRKAWDLLSGWSILQVTENRAIRRVIFLETIAGVPGMAGAMVRHLQSLRLMKRDNGWIHTLLEEAENERMHLLTAMQLHDASKVLRILVLIAQGVFTNVFFLCYLISPHFCHRFVGYLEEEAVKTYTHVCHEINEGNLQQWKTAPAPTIAKNYWQLGEDATVLNVFQAIRADEAHHRDVNHVFADLRSDAKNPFGLGE
jgi:hypothetical protein